MDKYSVSVERSGDIGGKQIFVKEEGVKTSEWKVDFMSCPKGTIL